MSTTRRSRPGPTRAEGTGLPFRYEYGRNRRPVLSYDGRRFAPAGTAGDTAVGHYHQAGDVVWAEFGGGSVRAGRLVGTCGEDGVVEAAYVQLLATGELAAGRMTSVPHLLPDGRVRLEERWRRDDGSAGTSWIEQLAD